MRPRGICPHCDDSVLHLEVVLCRLRDIRKKFNAIRCVNQSRAICVEVMFASQKFDIGVVLESQLRILHNPKQSAMNGAAPMSAERKFDIDVIK